MLSAPYAEGDFAKTFHPLAAYTGAIKAYALWSGKRHWVRYTIGRIVLVRMARSALTPTGRA